ncbi:hypothetical protein GOSPT_152_00030 [Gordonia sputi NBRC 100414]|uniref:Uncharacterized protein n=1 Tax=Gordonia sputi NBRC 100414 TaxID=1089453 RepID=H5U7J6_9ACTN|nr:hypothetical protein GOSPT_152_00030 [Gordonia sputi NBRC 100414]
MPSDEQKCVTRTNCEAYYDLPGHSDNSRSRADHWTMQTIVLLVSVLVALPLVVAGIGVVIGKVISADL